MQKNGLISSNSKEKDYDATVQDLENKYKKMLNLKSLHPDKLEHTTLLSIVREETAKLGFRLEEIEEICLSDANLDENFHFEELREFLSQVPQLKRLDLSHNYIGGTKFREMLFTWLKEKATECVVDMSNTPRVTVLQKEAQEKGLVERVISKDIDSPSMFPDVTNQNQRANQLEDLQINPFHIRPYSKRSFVVLGNYESFRAAFKSLGGQFDQNLSVDGKKAVGWVFSKTKEIDVAIFLLESFRYMYGASN